MFKLFYDSQNVKISASMVIYFKLVKENEKRLLAINLSILRIMWTIYEKGIL